MLDKKSIENIAHIFIENLNQDYSNSLNESLDKSREYYDESYDMILSILEKASHEESFTKSQLIMTLIDLVHAHKRMRSEYVDLLKNNW